MMLFYDIILLSFFQNPYFKKLRQSVTSLGYGTTRCLNTASRLSNRINTTQDEEEEEKAGPSAKHGHTAQDGMIL